MYETRFQMRQCRDDDCRLRFPAPVEAGEPACPHCQGPTAPVVSFANRGAKGILPPPKLVVAALLDNIRSIYNVGAMLRTADGAGLRHLYLCGITATPDHPKVAKTALGAETVVPWTYYRNALDATERLLHDGYELWGLESGPSAEPLFSVKSAAGLKPVVLVVGNELAGIDPNILDSCNRIISIPMQGVKASLNAAVAFGIAAYYVRYGIQP